MIAVAWALVLAERWVVKDHGGLIVAGASYLGVVLGARSAGIAKKSLVFLLYPLISVAICLAADTSVADPWGVSWLWVAAILGPVARRAHAAEPVAARPRADAEAPLGRELSQQFVQGAAFGRAQGCEQLLLDLVGDLHGRAQARFAVVGE